MLAALTSSEGFKALIAALAVVLVVGVAVLAALDRAERRGDRRAGRWDDDEPGGGR